jgi:hypothetical protein
MITMAVVLDNVKCHLVRHRPPVFPSVHRRITDLQVCCEFLLGNSQGRTHIEYCFGKIHGVLIHIAYYNICYPFNEVIIVQAVSHPPFAIKSSQIRVCVKISDNLLSRFGILRCNPVFSKINRADPAMMLCGLCVSRARLHSEPSSSWRIYNYLLCN